LIPTKTVREAIGEKELGLVVEVIVKSDNHERDEEHQHLTAFLIEKRHPLLRSTFWSHYAFSLGFPRSNTSWKIQ
jgi:hypothetical protein